MWPSRKESPGSDGVSLDFPNAPKRSAQGFPARASASGTWTREWASRCPHQQHRAIGHAGVVGVRACAESIPLWSRTTSEPSGSIAAAVRVLDALSHTNVRDAGGNPAFPDFGPVRSMLPPHQIRHGRRFEFRGNSRRDRPRAPSVQRHGLGGRTAVLVAGASVPGRGRGRTLSRPHQQSTR